MATRNDTGSAANDARGRLLDAPYEIAMTALGVALIVGGILDQAIDVTRLFGFPLPAPGALAGRIAFVLLGLALFTTGLAGRWLRAATGLVNWLRDPRRAARSPEPPSRPTFVFSPGKPAQLPEAIDEFTGREEVLDKLIRRVQDPDRPARIIAISGKGGGGKSELAVKLAHEVKARFLDAQLYVDFRSSTSDPLPVTDALRLVIRSLTNAPEPDLPIDEPSLVGVYRTLVANKRALLILDNVGTEAQVRPLLPSSRICLVLITSRHPLDGLTSAEQLRVDDMTDNEAIDILAAIAGPDVAASENRLAAITIADQCGHLPLALSIAGALIRVRRRRNPARPVQDVIRMLASEAHRLDELEIGDRSIRACFDASYAELSQQQRTLWRRLRLLPAPTFTAGMAAALIESSPVVTEQLLDQLVDLQVLESTANQEYKFHDLIGLYAAERLTQEEPVVERQAAAKRVLQLYLWESLRYASQLDRALRDLGPDIGGPGSATLADQLVALDWFEDRVSSLTRAVELAAEMAVPREPGTLDRELHQLTWKLAASLVPFLELRGYTEVWAVTNRAAVKAADAIGDLLGQAWTSMDAGRLLWVLNEGDEALERLQHAKETSLAKHWRTLEARARFTQGQIQDERGELRVALGTYHHAYDLFGSVGSVPDQFSAIFATATVCHRLGQLDSHSLVRLTERALKSLELAREDVWTLRMRGDIESFLAVLCGHTGALEQAGSHYIGSRDTYRRIGFRYGEARAARNIGRVRAEQGNIRLAAEDLEQSAERFYALRKTEDEADVRLLLGDVLTRSGDRPKAVEQWQRALDLLSAAGSSRTGEALQRLQPPR